MVGLLDRLLSPWRWYQRRIDLVMLWPSCKQLAPDLDHAKMAFAVHAFHDPAWMTLGEMEVMRRIDRLK